MSDFATGFVTGFANTLAEGVNERNKIARDYFQKQYELATTVGLENHRKVEQQVSASVKTAKQLQQMGVPKEIIMAVASQDPMGLSSFYEDISQAQASGIPIDQEFFNDFVQVSEDFKAPEEDFYTFFKKALSPIQRAAETDPEGFKKDRKGGIFAAMMGADPYGRARRQLDETVVIDGLSASELARYGSDYTPTDVEGAPTVTYDYGKVASRKPSSQSDLSISEINSIDKTVEDKTQQIIEDARAAGSDISREEAQKQAVEQTRITYGSVPEALEYIESTYGIQEVPIEEVFPEEDTVASEIGAEPAGTSPEAVETLPAPTTTPPPTEFTAPFTEGVEAGPINPEQEGLYNITIKGINLTWTSNNDDGTVTYVDQNGEEYIFDPIEVRAFVSQYGTEFDG